MPPAADLKLNASEKILLKICGISLKFKAITPIQAAAYTIEAVGRRYWAAAPIRCPPPCITSHTAANMITAAKTGLKSVHWPNASVNTLICAILPIPNEAHTQNMAKNNAINGLPTPFVR